MLLSRDDAELFFRLHRSLMHFVNQRLGIVPNVASRDEFSALPPKQRLDVRKAFLDDVDLIELFADENPAHLGEDELDIVLSWRHHVSGTFYIFRQLKNYMVFLSSAESPVAYGVVALTEPFEDVIGPYLPRMSETVLLPFQGGIVYDGLLSGYNISFGGGIKRMLNDSYRQAKERQGIVTSLPIEAVPIPAAKSSKLRKSKKTSKKTLKLGKGSAFVKSRLRRLPQSDDVWEADFLPEADHWMGLVVEQEHGAVLAMKMLEAAPSVNDLAHLLSDAMHRPLYDGCHRPQTVRLRDNPEWQELVRHLHELRIDVEISDDLPAWDDSVAEYKSPVKDLWRSLRSAEAK